MACASCGAVQEVDARFCSRCGAPLYRPCPACGAEHQSSALFCSACGTALQEVFAAGQEATKRRSGAS